MHISPRTVAFLGELGHDVIRVSDVLAATATDVEIVQCAISNARIVLTQDLDFSALVGLSGESAPSVVTLRISSSRLEVVNGVLSHDLHALETDLERGALVTMTERGPPVRSLPLG